MWDIFLEPLPLTGELHSRTVSVYARVHARAQAKQGGMNEDANKEGRPQQLRLYWHTAEPGQPRQTQLKSSNYDALCESRVTMIGLPNFYYPIN